MRIFTCIASFHFFLPLNTCVIELDLLFGQNLFFFISSATSTLISKKIKIKIKIKKDKILFDDSNFWERDKLIWKEENCKMKNCHYEFKK